MVLYFMDRTDVEVAVRECADARPVFCIIRIDNMSEVTSEMTDVERSSLLSDVTEKVLSYFNERTGSSSSTMIRISSHAFRIRRLWK